MAKKYHITNEAFQRVLKRIIKEEYEDVDNNYEPFKSQEVENEDGHGESIVGKNVDPTVYDKNAGL